MGFFISEWLEWAVASNMCDRQLTGVQPIAQQCHQPQLVFSEVACLAQKLQRLDMRVTLLAMADDMTVKGVERDKQHCGADAFGTRQPG